MGRPDGSRVDPQASEETQRISHRRCQRVRRLSDAKDKRMAFDWTPDTITRLREMWAEGYSASQIGQTFRLTRNAIIGKVHRLGLPGRRTTQGNKPGRKPKPSFMLARYRRHKKRRPIVAARVKPSIGVELINLRPNQCRWPYGDGPFTFCGHAVRSGCDELGNAWPYCEGHCAQAYHPRDSYESYADKAA